MHTQGLLWCAGNTASLSGTYCTVPPVMSLLKNTRIQAHMSKHTHIHTQYMEFRGCAWQTEKAEKEFKGNVLARGEESRTRRGEQTVLSTKRSCKGGKAGGDDIITVCHFFSRCNTFEFVTCKRLHKHVAVCTICIVPWFLTVSISSPPRSSSQKRTNNQTLKQVVSL